MRVIDYRRHFALLSVAAVVLVASLRLPLPVWLPRGEFFFGLMGVLHALVVLGSLKVVASLARRFVFVIVTAVISVLAPLAGFWLVGLAAEFLGDFSLWVALVVASAVGVSAYWFWVRWSLVASLAYRSLGFAIGLCAVITPMTYLGGAALTGFGRQSDGLLALGADVLPIIAWWGAFSLSLYRGEFSNPAIAAPKDSRSCVRA